MKDFAWDVQCLSYARRLENSADLRQFVQFHLVQISGGTRQKFEITGLLNCMADIQRTNLLFEIKEYLHKQM